MGEILSSLKENKKKKNWNPYHDELFSTLDVDDVDKSIIPYIELLKTSDFRKAKKRLKADSHFFEVNKNIEESFMKFIDYLLENSRYKEFFKQSMERYKISGDNKEIYEKVYNTTLGEFESIVKDIKDGKSKLSIFQISQVIKLLRGDAFIFELGEGFVWFEKDYLYGDEAKRINEDHTDKPVSGFRMHVGEGASIYSLGLVFKEMGEFIKNVDIGAKPYIGMHSRLLDIDFLRYRLKNKGRSDEKIDAFISSRYGILGDISLTPISDPKSYKRVSKLIKNHLSEKDKELIKSYEEEGNKLKEGKCLINLTTFSN